MGQSRTIARRELFYSPIGDGKRYPCAVCISEPYSLRQSEVSFPIDERSAGCTIVFEGLPEPDTVVYGVDSVQALELAANLDALLKTKKKRYEFFWADGDPYFDDEV